MNIMETMESRRGNFTPNDELIYQRIMADPSGVASLTTSVLAEQCGVSQPALTRFVKSLGFARYQDFRTSLVSWVVSHDTAEPQTENHLPYFDIVRDEITGVENLLTDDFMRDLASYVGSFNRVFAVGVTKSHHPAMLLEQLMLKTGRLFQALEIGLVNEACDAMDERDLIIVFTLSQRNALFSALQNTEGKVLLVTATPKGPLSKIADRQVVFPSMTSNPEESAISPIMFSLFVELLSRYLMME